MNFDRAMLQKLYRYAYSLTGDEDSAYDLLHSALEVCLKKPPLDDAKTLAYVRTIMRNRYIDEFRAEQRYPTDSIDDHALIDMDGSSLENIVIAEHDLSLIWKHLDVFDREILFYWAVEGYSMQEIANQIDVPRGTYCLVFIACGKKLLPVSMLKWTWEGMAREAVIKQTIETGC